jgi:hypothetical protein
VTRHLHQRDRLGAQGSGIARLRGSEEDGLRSRGRHGDTEEGNANADEARNTEHHHRRNQYYQNEQAGCRHDLDEDARVPPTFEKIKGKQEQEEDTATTTRTTRR